MKKLFKYILISVTIFFIGTINIKAENATNMVCTYKLPYVGAELSSYSIISDDVKPKSLYFTAQITITNGDISNLALNNYKNETRAMYPSQEFKDYIDQNKKCPEYINTNVVFWKTAGVIAKGFVISTADKKDDSIIVLKVSDSNTFINNVKKNSGNSDLNKLPSLGTHKFVMPLYSIKNTENGKVTEKFSSSTMQKYVDTTLDGWNTLANDKLSYVKNACGEDWINSPKYNESSYCAQYTNDYKSLLKQLSNYLDAIGTDGSIRKLANKTKFNNLYNQVNSIGAVSEKLKEEISKEEDLNDKRNLLNELSNNKCLGYCNYENSTSANYCKSGNVKYKNCRTCYTSTCKNKNGTELETCLSECLGQDEYNTLNNLVEQYKKKLETQISTVSSSLYKTNVPTLEGISFSPYKVQCSDFSILHIFWQIVTISAPILTILFGILDYGKAVISSDEEKIRKSWKKFPKRLVAMLILIIIPILISIVVSNFGTNDGVKDTSILKCVVNGE